LYPTVGQQSQKQPYLHKNYGLGSFFASFYNIEGDKPTQEGSVIPDKAAQVAVRKQALKERERKKIAFITE
jgi:hypothetical protein